MHSCWQQPLLFFFFFLLSVNEELLVWEIEWDHNSIKTNSVHAWSLILLLVLSLHAEIAKVFVLFAKAASSMRQENPTTYRHALLKLKIVMHQIFKKIKITTNPFSFFLSQLRLKTTGSCATRKHFGVVI